MKDIIDLIPKRTKTLSPKKFLRLTAKERADIKSSRFVPPKLGEEGFGKFVVIVKNPEYCLVDGE